jgi:putative flippase GtrA
VVASPGVSVDEAAVHGASRAGSVFKLPDPRRATRADWAQLLRFCAVGASGYVVNLAVFTVLVTLLDVHYAGAAVVAFCVAWLNNFVLNRAWTFRHGELSMWTQAVRYLLVSLIALGLNLGVLHLLVQWGMPEIPAQAIAIAAVTPVSFLLTRRWALR